MENSSRVRTPRRSVAAWLVALALAGTPVVSDPIVGVVRIEGTGQPLRNARIVGLSTGRVAWADSSGRFALPTAPGRRDGARATSGVLGGTRLVLLGSGERFEWCSPDGARRPLGPAPARLDPRMLPQGVGWIVSRSEHGERRWFATRIGAQLMIRPTRPPPVPQPPTDLPESLSVRWAGRSHRIVAAKADSILVVEMPRVVSVAGDFHTHTFLSDGSHTLDDVAAHAFGGTWSNRDANGDPLGDSTVGGFGLDWFANADHGGAFGRDRHGRPLSYLPDSVFEGVSTGGYMWRWQSLRDLSWPAVDSLREVHPEHHIFQGLEWNVPTHEHASVGILARGPAPIARFEFLFDDHDFDTLGPHAPDAASKIRASSHAKALAGARWLREHHGDSSWIVVNHPSRLRRTSLQDLRDLHDAGGPVFLGIEGIPGHQRAASRGGYSYTPPPPDDPTSARTFGGADIYLAKVGGVMDSLWSEGRRVWVFANSDFHHGFANDHYPGLFSKNITRVPDRSDTGILWGLRSGATVAVMGDLVDSFSLEIDDGARTASMGQSLSTARDSVDVLVRFHTPSRSALGDIPSVHHVDLIRGVASGAGLTDSVIATVVATGAAGPSSKAPDGWHGFAWRVPASPAGFFRVRGSSRPKGVPGWTDSLGNPLCDDLQYPNEDAKARSNLWFYSNPVFLQRR